MGKPPFDLIAITWKFCISNKMATSPSFIFIFLVFVAAQHTTIITTSAEFICDSTSCSESGGVSIRFPFSLREANQSHLCGYPGFELTCSISKTTTTSLVISEPLLTLPESGDLVVKQISLENQRVWVNDPDECLPKRLMRDHGFNLKGSPFRISDYYMLVDFNFLNCPSNLTNFALVRPISCLNFSSGDGDYSVVVMMSDPPFPTPWNSSCRLISSASIPVQDMPSLFWTDYYSDIPLQWDNPDCATCESRGGRCGFLGDPAFHVACYDLPTQGLSRKAKYGISLGLGIPGLLGITVLTCVLCTKKNRRSDQQRQTSTEFSTLTLTLPHPPVVFMGLDGASIEKYPKTQLGESGRLPRPNDNICSICLCEYQPKETLRTIPECNHYFHANCIDGWLKMNATCPLCRNLPERSTSFPSTLPLSPTS